jgi:hypothetical protein
VPISTKFFSNFLGLQHLPVDQDFTFFSFLSFSSFEDFMKGLPVFFRNVLLKTPSFESFLVLMLPIDLSVSGNMIFSYKLTSLENHIALTSDFVFQSKFCRYRCIHSSRSLCGPPRLHRPFWSISMYQCLIYLAVA